MKTLDTIHHIAINVADLKAALNWYTTSYACEVQYQDLQRAVLQFENVKLTLVLPSQEPAHLAFVREDASALGELQERREGWRSTFLSDPTGNIIEIVEK
ncbi:VOC family protein [bacterium]|nr:VOC family protein [bacterium]